MTGAGAAALLAALLGLPIAGHTQSVTRVSGSFGAAGNGDSLSVTFTCTGAPTCSAGELYRTSGPAFNSNPFTPIGAGDLAAVGTMRLRFADGDNATLTYTYQGTQVVKSITRQVFSSPVSACN